MKSLFYSRPIATAERLGENALDHHRFLDKKVLLTAEQAILSTTNGQECLKTSLRLLIRICSNVYIALPSGFEKLLNECKEIAEKISFNSPVEFMDSEPNLNCYDAILSVGATVRPDLPWTAINSNGWVARVSSGCINLPSDTNETNQIASLAAACLGVTEIFKRLLRIKESRCRFFDGLAFSLYTYNTDFTDIGPKLPDVLHIDNLLLVGAGAIGNGVIHLLNLLPFSGSLKIVDRQTFQPENLGTCLLVGPSDVDTEKAIFAERILNKKLDVKGYPEDILVFKDRLGKEIPYPKVIINGLDKIKSRHEVQKLWPDLIIDGAIGDFGCQVSRHPWGEDTACLICLFREAQNNSAEKVASNATGLCEKRIGEVSEIITEDDISAAPVNKRDWLRARLGHQICSVVQEGIAQQISMEKQREGFEPSIPFAACFSAAMIIAELVKFITGKSTSLEPRYQFDILSGPAYGFLIPQERRRDCMCFTRERNINTLRRQRCYYVI